MNKAVTSVILGALALLSLPASTLIAQHFSNGYGSPTSNLTVNNFEWSDTNGDFHRLADWDDGYTFVFVGFLSCRVICHPRIQQLLDIHRQLNKKVLAADDIRTTNQRYPVRFLFITLDPVNDTLDLRREIIDKRASDFYSAKLSTENLSQLTNELREFVTVNANNEFSHSGNIYLLNEQQKVERVYSTRFIDVNAVIKDLPDGVFLNTRYSSNSYLDNSYLRNSIAKG